MEDTNNTNTVFDTLEKPDFATRLKLWFALPSVFHGLLMGGLLFASKVVFYITGNWHYILEPTFLFLSFLMIIYAILMASRSERREYQQYYTYKRALFSAFRVLTIALALSVIADGVLYNADPNLSDQAIQLQMEKTIEGFKQITFIQENEKDEIIKSIKDQKLGSASTLVSAWLGKIMANGIFVLIIAIYTRYRKPYAWLNDNANGPQGNS